MCMFILSLGCNSRPCYQAERNTWRIVNELISRKSRNSVINEIKLPCGNSIYDSHDPSNAFNDHFFHWA